MLLRTQPWGPPRRRTMPTPRWRPVVETKTRSVLRASPPVGRCPHLSADSSSSSAGYGPAPVMSRKRSHVNSSHLGPAPRTHSSFSLFSAWKHSLHRREPLVPAMAAGSVSAECAPARGSHLTAPRLRLCLLSPIPPAPPCDTTALPLSLPPPPPRTSASSASLRVW